MELSALIFVALAVAWAVYLIPKAMKHHDEVVRDRSVDKFSDTMRVLARREPIDHRNARLVVTPTREDVRPPVETKARAVPARPTTAPPQASRRLSPQAARAASRSAAKRRRNVLFVVLLANTIVTALAAAAVIVWPWTALSAGVLVAWLLACRLSVVGERRARQPRPVVEERRPARSAAVSHEARDDQDDQDDQATGTMAPVPAQRVSSPAAEAPAVLTGEIPIIRESIVGGWDMVPTTLPTYVTKSAAQRRTVATIDLESTGVWSSGHSDEDSALARSAEQASKAARVDEDTRRVSGA